MSKPYIHTEEIHNLTSPRIIVPLVLEMVKPESILDVGCGTGTWLKAFEEHGIKDYIGIDGDYVDRRALKISPEKFLSIDLRKEWSLNRKFDLVVSLEVAEHLPEEVADLFVSMLSSHGEIILFSAAIPGQGGQNHLNEQWPEYWEEKFKKLGYYFHDIVRPAIWNTNGVEWWYKQNIFLISRNSSDKRIERFIHPDLFRYRLEELENFNHSLKTDGLGIRHSFTLFLKSLFRFVKK